MSPTTAVRDVAEDDFQSQVVDASHVRPVVVDFWAAWCGPCTQLSPVLEEAAARHAGDVDVVKVDVESASKIAQEYGVQGIPAVKAFRNGRIVSEFTGLQPESKISEFFVALLPTEVDRLVASAATAEDAEARLMEALDREPGHVGAGVQLARRFADAGDLDKAHRLLARFPGHEQADRLLAELHMDEQRVDSSEIEGLRAAAADGGSAEQLALGQALAAGGEYEEALTLLVGAVADPGVRADARDAVLEVFRVLGEGHELVKQWRPLLARALF